MNTPITAVKFLKIYEINEFFHEIIEFFEECMFFPGVIISQNSSQGLQQFPSGHSLWQAQSGYLLS